VSASIVVVSWGVGGRVVDLGRPGRARLGASRGGAVDVAALRLGNRLVGNPESVAGLETSGGLTLRCDTDVMVAVTGAMVEIATDGAPVGWGSPVVLRAGTTLRVTRLVGGARAYLAVRGGLDPNGDHLAVGPDPRTSAATEPAVPPAFQSTARVWPGPRVDWFASDTWGALCANGFTVSATSRVGARLDGPRLIRSVHRELPSEGLIEGAVQVPPDGLPIVMLADHPTTGGYPVVAVVDPADIITLAQAPVGGRVRFVDARRRR
jgi:allophanate hydrolase subunit 2